MPERKIHIEPAELLKFYKSGMTMQALGDKFNVTRERIRQILCKNPGFRARSGWAKPPSERPELPWHRQAVAMRAAGHSVREISEKLGKGMGIVHQVCRRYGKWMWVPHKKLDRKK